MYTKIWIECVNRVMSFQAELLNTAILIEMNKLSQEEMDGLGGLTADRVANLRSALLLRLEQADNEGDRHLGDALFEMLQALAERAPLQQAGPLPVDAEKIILSKHQFDAKTLLTWIKTARKFENPLDRQLLSFREIQLIYAFHEQHGSALLMKWLDRLPTQFIGDVYPVPNPAEFIVKQLGIPITVIEKLSETYRSKLLRNARGIVEFANIKAVPSVGLSLVAWPWLPPLEKEIHLAQALDTTPAYLNHLKEQVDLWELIEQNQGLLQQLMAETTWPLNHLLQRDIRSLLPILEQYSEKWSNMKSLGFSLKHLFQFEPTQLEEVMKHAEMLHDCLSRSGMSLENFLSVEPEVRAKVLGHLPLFSQLSSMGGMTIDQFATLRPEFVNLVLKKGDLMMELLVKGIDIKRLASLELHFLEELFSAISELKADGKDGEDIYYSFADLLSLRLASNVPMREILKFNVEARRLILSNASALIEPLKDPSCSLLRLSNEEVLSFISIFNQSEKAKALLLDHYQLLFNLTREGTMTLTALAGMSLHEMEMVFEHIDLIKEFVAEGYLSFQEFIAIPTPIKHALSENCSVLSRLVHEASIDLSELIYMDEAEIHKCISQASKLIALNQVSASALEKLMNLPQAERDAFLSHSSEWMKGFTTNRLQLEEIIDLPHERREQLVPYFDSLIHLLDAFDLSLSALLSYDARDLHQILEKAALVIEMLQRSGGLLSDFMQFAFEKRAQLIQVNQELIRLCEECGMDFLDFRDLDLNDCEEIASSYEAMIQICGDLGLRYHDLKRIPCNLRKVFYKKPFELVRLVREANLISSHLFTIQAEQADFILSRVDDHVRLMRFARIDFDTLQSLSLAALSEMVENIDSVKTLFLSSEMTLSDYLALSSEERSLYLKHSKSISKLVMHSGHSLKALGVTQVDSLTEVINDLEGYLFLAKAAPDKIQSFISRSHEERQFILKERYAIFFLIQNSHESFSDIIALSEEAIRYFVSNGKSLLKVLEHLQVRFEDFMQMSPSKRDLLVKHSDLLCAMAAELNVSLSDLTLLEMESLQVLIANQGLLSEMMMVGMSAKLLFSLSKENLLEIIRYPQAFVVLLENHIDLHQFLSLAASDKKDFYQNSLAYTKLSHGLNLPLLEILKFEGKKRSLFLNHLSAVVRLSREAEIADAILSEVDEPILVEALDNISQVVNFSRELGVSYFALSHYSSETRSAMLSNLELLRFLVKEEGVTLDHIASLSTAELAEISTYSYQFKSLIYDGRANFNDFMKLNVSTRSRLLENVVNIKMLTQEINVDFRVLSEMKEERLSELFNHAHIIVKFVRDFAFPFADLMNLAPGVRTKLFKKHLAVNQLLSQANLNLADLANVQPRILSDLLENADKVIRITNDCGMTLDLLVELSSEKREILFTHYLLFYRLINELHISIDRIMGLPEEHLNDLIMNASRITHTIKRTGLNFNEWLSLSPEMRMRFSLNEKLFSYLLREAKVSLSEINELAFEDLDSLIENARAVEALLRDGRMSFHALIALSRDKRALIVQSYFKVVHLINHLGCQIETLISFDLNKLTKLMGQSASLEILLKQAGLVLENLAEMSEENLSLLLENARAAVHFSRATQISLSSVLSLDSKLRQIVLASMDNVARAADKLRLSQDEVMRSIEWLAAYSSSVVELVQIGQVPFKVLLSLDPNFRQLVLSRHTDVIKLIRSGWSSIPLDQLQHLSTEVVLILLDFPAEMGWHLSMNTLSIAKLASLSSEELRAILSAPGAKNSKAILSALRNTSTEAQ